MRKPRTLFLQHEQRFSYWLEPGYLEVYRPMILSGLLGEVHTYIYQRDIRYFYSAGLTQIKDSKAVNEFVKMNIKQNIKQRIEDFNPDLIVYARTFVNEMIDCDTLKELKDLYKFKLISTFWDYDETNSSLMENDRRTIEVSDLVTVFDSSLRVDRIRSRSGLYADWENVGVVQFMPTIPDATLFKPSPIKRYDVTLSGSMEGFRKQIYSDLLASGINIHRSGGMMPNDQFLSHADYAREIAESRIVVNTQTLDYRVQLKGRVSQVLSCGSFLLEQNSPESTRFLSGIPVVTWDEAGDLIEKIQYWLLHQEEREKIAQKCHENYIGRYDCGKWTQAVLRFCNLI